MVDILVVYLEGGERMVWGRRRGPWKKVMV